MKKYLLLAVSALVFAFASCSDKVEIDLKYQTSISVSVDKLMAPFHEMYDGDFDIHEEWQIRIHTLIYDGNGDLVQSFVSGVNNYSNVSVCSLALNQGKYKVVSIADFIEGSVDSPSFNYWNVDGKEKLGNLSIEHSPYLWETAFETFGTASAEFEVDNTSQEIKLSIKPATALVQIILDYRDLYSGDGNGISPVALICPELWLTTPNQNNIMTGFDSDSYVFSQGSSQDTYYYLTYDYPSETVNEGYNAYMGYRALLPLKCKEIGYEITILNPEDGSTAVMEETFKNVNMTFEAGEQYFLEFELDSGLLHYGKLDEFQSTKSIDSDAVKNMDLMKKSSRVREIVHK